MYETNSQTKFFHKIISALKITFITCFGFPQGTYFRWHNLAIGLQRLGHKVTVHAVGPRGWGRTQFEIRDGVNYVLVPTTPLVHRMLDSRFDPVALIRAIRHNKEVTDIIHVFQPFPHSCLSGLFRRRTAQSLIFDWDDLWWGGGFADKAGFPWPDKWLPLAVRFLEQCMPRFVDGVTTCSSFLAEAAQKHGAVITLVIHNGYWPDQPAPLKLEARKAMGLDSQAFYFGFMGRTLGEISWCADALAATDPAGRKVRLALCGMAQSMVDALPDERRASIDYLGNLTPAQAQVFARAIDCGLLPLEDTPFNQSRFPIKFAEYLAGGAHVIASAVGEFADLATKLPGVTLAGQTRESWRTTFSTLDLEQLDTGFATSSSSMLAQKLDWEVLARQVQDFYCARLLGKQQKTSVAHSKLNESLVSIQPSRSACPEI
ncbi:MAG: glycosyltransferase [Verrucomicrobia bacterium]|nr:glycosyltransferase [Verrucomicrobiota bacterium]